MKSTYEVWTYDVWGNPRDGFWVNDRFRAGSVTLDSDASDADVIRALKDAQVINARSRITSFEIQGNDQVIHVNKITLDVGGYYPVCELVKDD
jgi:hypothetical protein